MESIGREKIKMALDNMTLDKEEYMAWEIDRMILNYHKIPKNVLLEDITESSNEFSNISEVYEYIDDLLNEKGYFTDDLSLYIKRVNNE